MLDYCHNPACDHPVKGVARRLRKRARDSGRADISGLPIAQFVRHVWIHRSWVRPVIKGGVGDVYSACELIGRPLNGTYPVFLRFKGPIK